MKGMQALGLVYAAAIVYQIYVTVAVLRSAAFLMEKKILFVVLIWILPLIGALIAHWMIHSASKRGQSAPS